MANKLIPKNFLCRYELKVGATAYGILMIVVMLACIIAAVIDLVSYKSSKESYSVKRSAYAFSIIIIIYSGLMIAVHLWFLWAVRKGKASVVVVWVAMNGLWLVQTTLLFIVLLCLFIPDSNLIAWIMCLIFGIIAFGELIMCPVFGIIAFVICIYGVLIGYGYWIEIKARQRLEASSS